jgi:hypothetical protein
VLVVFVLHVQGAYVLGEWRFVLASTRQGDLERRNEKMGWEVWEYLGVEAMDHVDEQDEER